MADKTRHKIKNLLMKLNDEDRNAFCCLLIKAGYAVRIGKERPGGKGQTMYFVDFGRRMQMPRKVWMPKSIARRPAAKTEKYLKYGFVITECEKYLCPRCGSNLNAGPNYQPVYCDHCGQKMSFRGVEWKEEKELGFAEGRKKLEQIENRMV